MTELQYDEIGRSEQREIGAYEEAFPEIMNHVGNIHTDDSSIDIPEGVSHE